MPDFASINNILENYRVFVQIAGLVGVVYSAAWLFRSARMELFNKLDKITDNHLKHIQENTQKSADTLVEMQVGLAAQDQRTQEIQTTLDRNRQMLSEAHVQLASHDQKSDDLIKAIDDFRQELRSK